jgi:hypothetical protein
MILDNEVNRLQFIRLLGWLESCHGKILSGYASVRSSNTMNIFSLRHARYDAIEFGWATVESMEVLHSAGPNLSLLSVCKRTLIPK